jgi:hypothetical protein
MECKTSKLNTSAYLDRQLTDAETVAYREHQAVCGDCRLYLAEVEESSLILRELETPEVPRELHSYVMREVVSHAYKEVTVEQQVLAWLTKFNPRLVSYSAGLIISAMLFGIVFSGFRPIPVPAAVASETAMIYPAVSGSEREYQSYNDLPRDNNAAPEDHYYQLPRMLDNSALVSFSHLVYNTPGREAMSAMVEVGPDGRARLLNVLNEPKDPHIIEQLWWSLRSRNFKPATVSGRPVSTRIIMFVEKVEIRG